MKGNQMKNIPIIQKSRNSSVIKTTIYELMEAVIDVADPDEKKLIKEVTLNLLAKAKPCVRVFVSKDLLTTGLPRRQ